MANDYKKDSLYVFGVVCANGVQDSWGDTLTKKDIKKLNSSYKKHETDTNHNYLKNIGVSVIENYITTVPMIVRGKDVPAGSWVMGTLVWDNTLKEGIRNGTINGYSLCSRPATPELMAKFINREDPPNYRDIEDKDDLNPLFVSLVNGAGNGYEFEYTTYSSYIERGKQQEENPMSDNEFDKYLKFMEAVDKYTQMKIERSNPVPPQENEDLKEIKEQLEETQKSYDALIERQTADKEELMNAISELKKQKEEQTEDDDPADQQEENPADDPQGQEQEEDPKGTDVQRGKPDDFQSESEVGGTKPQVVPVDKFFDDGYVPRNRGYGGLPV